ncbi:hypothetical protein [Streptomyces sp. NPDC094031]|uniref:hypothetical protein n=1 Tax=Streptomyces sp. NPDC094031 TaxID=3155307 RepID=UPI003327623C
MIRPLPGYSEADATATTVRVGDLVQLDNNWYRVDDLRQAGADRRAAVLEGMPGVWLLPSMFTVMRPGQA